MWQRIVLDLVPRAIAGVHAHITPPKAEARACSCAPEREEIGEESQRLGGAVHAIDDVGGAEENDADEADYVDGDGGA
eukprot:2812733-Pleurochrysis_carterae.AAC.4